LTVPKTTSNRPSRRPPTPAVRSRNALLSLYKDAWSAKRTNLGMKVWQCPHHGAKYATTDAWSPSTSSANAAASTTLYALSSPLPSRGREAPEAVRR